MQMAEKLRQAEIKREQEKEKRVNKLKEQDEKAAKVRAIVARV